MSKDDMNKLFDIQVNESQEVQGSKPTIIDKYFEALTDMHEILKHTKHFSVSKFIKEKKLSSTFSRAIQELGIADMIASGKNPKWIWLGGIPSGDMADVVVDYISEINKQYNEAKEKTAEKVVDKNQKKSTGTPHHYEVRLLWGLVTLRIKPIFDDGRN